MGCSFFSIWNSIFGAYFSAMIKFFKSNRYLLTYGLHLSFLSSFGQTFLISLYLPSIQEAFVLTDAQFSSIYSGATILSAFTLTWLGRFIDKVNVIKYTLFVMIGFMVMLLAFSQAYAIVILIFSLFGLRLFGQGLLTHTSVTSMARFFDKGRGKAISIASLGHPIGEIMLPFAVVSAIYAVGWRYAVLLSLLFVALSIPFVLYLLRKNVSFRQLRTYVPSHFSKQDQHQASPLNIMKTRIFWIVMPSALASAAIGTGFLLFKLKMGLSFGWSATYVAVGFSAYAVGNAAANILSGILADRYSGRVLFPAYLLPAILGFIALSLNNSEWVYIALIGGIGITNGFGSTIKNVVLTEMYGVKIIGSVRSLFITVMVFSTALGPFLFGLLLDHGFAFSRIAMISAIVYGLATLNAMRLLKEKPKKT